MMTNGDGKGQTPASVPPTPPAGSPMKSSEVLTPTKNFRPVGQQEELEALRQRGLAKLLNRHFTEATQKIAQEKAAAEAAVRDLEERRLQQQQQHPASPSRDGRLSQWEELYMKANKWRNECRQKERETLLLYQRYVDKFGGSGHVQVPAVEEGSAPPRVAASVQHLERQLESQRQDSNNIVIPSLNLLGAHETFASLYGKGEEEFRDIYRHQMEQQRKGDDAATNVASPEKNNATQKDQANASGKEQSPATAPTEPTRFESKLSDSSSEEEQEGEDIDEQDDDVLSLISGLTSVHSATTRRILMDCEQTVHTFLEEESKAVKAILSVAGHSKTSASGRSGGGSAALGSLQSKAATEAENMVKQMQGILQDFEEKQANLPTDAHQARPYYTANPEEKWMVYYDETFQREYYHEVHTNRTQWEPPSHADVTDVTSLSTAEQSGSFLAHVDVMPEVQKGRSLIAAYRRKSRRRRQKRLAFAAAFTLALAGAGCYVYATQPELVVSMREHVRPVETALNDLVGDVRQIFVGPDSQRVVQQVPPPFPVVVEEPPTAVQRREEEEELRRKLAEELALKRAEEARLKRQAKALAEAAAEAARLEYLRRPVGCNIPLAYLLNRRCYRLSSENPPYDAFGLVQAMMQ
eukprot:scaffold28621_cov144-Amphora_coffeaeformis.AAC.2